MNLTFQKRVCPLWQWVVPSIPTEGPYFNYLMPLIMQHTHTQSAVRGYRQCFRGISFTLAGHGEICGTVLCAQSRPTLCNPMDCSPLDSSVRGIFQARILEWVVISSSRGSSWPRDWTCVSCVSCIGRQILYHWAACSFYFEAILNNVSTDILV